MSAPILATKLYIPSLRPNIVRRPRLVERMNEGLHRKLTLISAPAGFGKTTVVSEWIEAIDRSTPPVAVAWLSLDEADHDLTRFLIYLVSALHTVAPNIGEAELAVLQSPQQPPTESILTALLNVIATISDSIILVLDDYHLVDAGPAEGSTSVDKALTFLIDHQPPQMHVVITTREDPRLPLARLRGRGQLTELRLAELRFNPAEAAEFLNQVMGLELSETDIAALETRTEGWIAGLHLAAISMQGQTDAAGFIHSFTGSHRFVLDYLVEEVLQKQAEGVQAFLLCTSILDRLCGSLCDAVLHNVSAADQGNTRQEAGGQNTLEYLERLNLFIFPLDNERRWYRYHPLFAELLRMRLDRTYPDLVTVLHQRASDWHARNDLPNEAVTHALAIQDWPRAAEIIERYSDQWPMRGEIHTLLGWLESFPAQIRLERTGLGLVYAWALYMNNQLDRADQCLNQLMPFVQTTTPMLGEIFAIRVMIAAFRYDLPAVVELARQAFTLVPPEEAAARSRILISLGVAHYEIGGDIAAARSAFHEAYELGNVLAPSSVVGNAPLPLTALAYLSEIEWLQGNLRNAYRMYEQALDLAKQWGGQPSIPLCLVQRGRAGLLYEWNALDQAASALQESIRIGKLWNSPYFLVHPYGLSAMVLQARGNMDGALAMIQRAEQITRESHSTPLDIGLLALYQIALWIAQNDYQTIAQWEQDHDTEWRSRIGRVRDHLALVLAHAYIARYYQLHENSALDKAGTLIEPLVEKAQTSGLMFYETRFIILEALIRYAQGQTVSAISTLKRALALAEPENYFRSFIDLGKPMEELLRRALESQSLDEPHLAAYAGRLLSQFSIDDQNVTSQPANDALIEPLADRELEILKLIAQGLSNREISERLFLALSTVKGYNRIIFDKLQVQRRTEAVARARQLGLLT